MLVVELGCRRKGAGGRGNLLTPATDNSTTQHSFLIGPPQTSVAVRGKLHLPSAAHRTEIYPLAVAAEISRTRTADRRVCRYGRIVVHASAAVRDNPYRRVTRRAGDSERGPDAVFAAELLTGLAAGRTGRIGNAGELTVL